MGHDIMLTASDGHALDAYLCEPYGECKGSVIVVQEIFVCFRARGNWAYARVMNVSRLVAVLARQSDIFMHMRSLITHVFCLKVL